MIYSHPVDYYFAPEFIYAVLSTIQIGSLHGMMGCIDLSPSPAAISAAKWG